MRKFYAVVGSRDFNDLDKVDYEVARLVSSADDPGDVTIVSGGARGVDNRAEAAAMACGAHVVSYRPREDDKTGLFLIDVYEDGEFSHDYGHVFSKFRSAAMFRNGLIMNTVQEALVFWNGVSTGTLDSKQKAHERGIPVMLYLQEEQ